MSEKANFANIVAGVQEDPSCVVLLLRVDDGMTWTIELPTTRAIDNLIESLKLARIAVHGLDMPSRHPLGYRHFRTG